eukprot:COSAG01_NODE_39429_length_476_cov_2.766578_1_plen_107_part_10
MAEPSTSDFIANFRDTPFLRLCNTRRYELVATSTTTYRYSYCLLSVHGTGTWYTRSSKSILASTRTELAAEAHEVRDRSAHAQMHIATVRARQSEPLRATATEACCC